MLSDGQPGGVSNTRAGGVSGHRTGATGRHPRATCLKGRRPLGDAEAMKGDWGFPGER